MGLPNGISKKEKKAPKEIVELIKNDKCDIKVNDEGTTTLSCKTPEHELNPFEVKLISGVSELAEDQQKTPEEKPLEPIKEPKLIDRNQRLAAERRKAGPTPRSPAGTDL